MGGWACNAEENGEFLRAGLTQPFTVPMAMPQTSTTSSWKIPMLPPSPQLCADLPETSRGTLHVIHVEMAPLRAGRGDRARVPTSEITC